MATKYTIRIGDTVTGLTITEIHDENLEIRFQSYSYACKCGAKGRIKRGQLTTRIKKSAEYCGVCVRAPKDTADEAEEARKMAFVNKFWKIPAC